MCPFCAMVVLVSSPWIRGSRNQRVPSVLVASADPQPAGLGFLTGWPAGQSQPVASTVNAPSNAAVANAAIVPAGNNGDVSVFTTHNTDLVIAVNGYFAPGAPTGLSFFPLTPSRVVDTLNPHGNPPLNGQRDANFVPTRSPHLPPPLPHLPT